ncbi:MAG: hypothetical protein ACJ0RF_00275 [Luminiphilus sp.]|jgi:hypothetical protein
MIKRYVGILCFICLSVGCAQERHSEAVTRVATPVNMAGHWEIDFARSDNLQDQLSSIARRVQREATRRARLAEEGRGFAGSPLPDQRDLITLARLAEIITEPVLLEVIQSDSRIRVKREKSFALVCEYDGSGLGVTVDTLGIQRCGWDGDQLYFAIELEEGLDVTHRLSRAKETDTLLMVTSVETTATRFPMVVSQYFTPYDPDALGYRCERTLTRGKVCSTQ